MAATLDDLRAAALALPQAVEKEHFSAPAFRVGEKIFAQIAVKTPEVAILRPPRQRAELLWEAEPDTFFRIPWGARAAFGVVLERIELAMLKELVQASWRETAPKALVASFLAAPPFLR